MMMLTDPVRVASRFHTASAFDDALSALASQARVASFYEEGEAAEEIRDVLSGELTQILNRIAKLLFSKMTKFRASLDTQEEWNGEEFPEHDTYGDMMWTGYNITFPYSVTGGKAIFSRYGKLVDAFKSDRTIRGFKLSAGAIDAFFADPGVQRFIESKVVDFGRELESEPDFFSRGSGIEDRAKEVVYANSEYDVTQTVYREDGEEEKSVVPDVRYSLNLGRSKVKVTKAGLSGGKITLGVGVTWDVSFGQAAFPWDYAYDRIVP